MLPSKAEFPMLCKEEGKNKVSRFPQLFEKAPASINFTPSGIEKVFFTSFLQPENACSPIFTTPDMFTFSNASHQKKASPPIYVRHSGKVMLFMTSISPSKAPSITEVTG